MIGLVFWNDNVFDPSSAYALEYFYLPVNKLVVGRVNGVLQYNWAYIDNQLNDIASRGHQAIFRPRYGIINLVLTHINFFKNIITISQQLSRLSSKTYLVIKAKCIMALSLWIGEVLT